MIDVTAGERGPATADDTRTLPMICAAHFISHYHILVLPMLFPFLKDTLKVDYIELGFALTLFAVISGLTQAPMGYLVDRVGARKILVLGLGLGGSALILLAATLSYGWLIVCALMLGLANSVYHPADYAILAATTSEKRMGRAFSVHTFSGYLGSAVAPAAIAALLTTVGGTGALVVSGALGIAVGLMLIVLRIPETRPVTRRDDSAAASGSMLTPAVVLLTMLFMLISLSSGGISNFGVVALMSGYAMPLTLANMALTGLLGAAALGVLAGGFLADRTERHDRAAAACFAVSTLVIGTVALTSPGPVTLIAALTVSGFFSGMIAPSRDMMVRNAAPPGATGRAFGIVSTGINIAGIASPLLFGWIMDLAVPRWVFGASAIFMLLTVLLTLVTDRRRPVPVPA